MRHTTEVLLAIFPFENLSEDGKPDVLCRGIYIDLVTELSRFRQISIIDTDSISEVDDEIVNKFKIPVNYIIKGSCFTSGDHIRIYAQLIDVATDRVVWADRYQGSKESVFSIQQDLLEKIIGSLQQHLNHDLIAQIRKKEPVTFSAYENCIYGFDELRKGTLEADEKARVFFQRALEIAPDFSLAHSGMSLTYFNEWSCQVWDRWEVSQKGAFEWAKKAWELDEKNHIGALVLGRVYLYEGQYALSERYLRFALHLNNNDIDSLTQIASCFVFLGYADEAQTIYERVLKLDPFHTGEYDYLGAFIAFERGDDKQCVALGDTAFTQWVDFPAFVAAAYFNLGDLINMSRHWERFVKLFETKISRGNAVDLEDMIKWLRDVNPHRYDSRMQSMWQHLRNGELETSETTREVEFSSQNYFNITGEVADIHFHGKRIQLVRMKGLSDLARMLAEPRKSFHCTELMGAGVSESPVFALDEKAKRSYREKILELQSEIKVSEDNNDLRKSAELQTEYDQLVDHLSSSLGLSGRKRKLNDTLDKTRSAVTWRIRQAIKRIEKVHPLLARHLNASIKTGLFCTYSPEKEVRWEINIH